MCHLSAQNQDLYPYLSTKQPQRLHVFKKYYKNKTEKYFIVVEKNGIMSYDNVQYKIRQSTSTGGI